MTIVKLYLDIVTMSVYAKHVMSGQDSKPEHTDTRTQANTRMKLLAMRIQGW